MFNDNIADNITKVEARIQQATAASGRNRDGVLLLAVSKSQPASAVKAAFTAGLCHFGENYLQEALAKMAECAGLPLTWHFIGAIQSNKTQAIASHFSWVHSIDRIGIAQRLQRQRPPSLPPLEVCVQVNIDAEPNKAGVNPDAVANLIEEMQALDRLRIRGLMAIPDPDAPKPARQASFRRMQTLLGELQAGFPTLPLDTLSMGMTDDLEDAIAAGATIVRVGTALFGTRKKREYQG